MKFFLLKSLNKHYLYNLKIKKIFVQHKYQKLNFINIGTYGKVFKTKKIKTKKIYACKEIKAPYQSSYFCISLLREITLLLSINHPNIIFTKEAFFRIGFEHIFIVTEYCEYDLKTILDSRIKLSQIQIKFIIHQLLFGLKILHENQIIHRDIKTTNILLNNKGIVKICDFGLSKYFTSIKTQMTQGVVTLWYRAPEILLGFKKYDMAIDIWSIGCVFGELALNEVLLQGKSELDQLIKIFSLLGTPTSDIWTNLHLLDIFQTIQFPVQPFNILTKKLKKHLCHNGLDLLNHFLTYDPLKRISAKKALLHPYFK